MSQSANASNSAPPQVERPAPLLIRVIDRMTSGFAVLASLGVILLILNIFIDVVGRKLFNAPFAGTIERTAYWWMPTLALLAFAFAELKQEHIKVTILLDALPRRMRQIVEGFFGLIATALLIALVFYSWQDAMKSFGFLEVTSSRPPVEIWPARFIAVAGVAMLALQSAATTFRHFAGLPPTPRAYDTEADTI